jgi:hypothetical protein
VTEREWLECGDPGPMLQFLRGKASDRKLRLFAWACCSRVRHLLSDRYNRKALSVAQRYADGDVSEEKLGFAWGDARRAAQVAYRRERETAEASAMWAVSMLCEADLGRVVAAVGWAAQCEASPLGQPRLADVQREQVVLLRDIVGNPFRPLTFDPAWKTPAVLLLARSLYEERRFEDLPVLADALEEAGCTDAGLLGHLRSAGPHFLGCWGLDVVLGKG